MIANLTKRAGLAAAALTALIFVSPQAFAAGPYDGTWVLDFPAAGLIQGDDDYACPALRLPVQVKDGQVIGTLHRVPSASGGVEVEAGPGPDAVPVTGSVQPDGTVDAQWGPYRASGKLSGNGGGEVSVTGECGPRVAQAFHVGTPSYPMAAELGN